ncbi:galactose oxidase [Gigaspora margarita]|uniref:Galactose oxidase n=1 Tax=Gigaspora margarita TaxID=4874 RepID=A0A8H4ER07_GIGMA|nr:galactose oxidase [Gigaspora margarita]
MIYFSLYIFVFLLNFIVTFAFVPNGRYLHSSVLVDKKLYFSGGFKSTKLSDATTNEFFYLDISKPFTTTDNDSIPWVDLTYTNNTLKIETTACIGGKDNDMIFIFGDYPYFSQLFVNQFDINKQQWTNITTIGNVPRDRIDISCAKFNNGLIAIFSGYILNNTNDLWIFNTLTLTWSLSNATNAPLSMRSYCAITLPDENILFIGGINPNKNSYIQMNSLSLYNTKSDTWTNKNTSGPIPPVRVYFQRVIKDLDINVTLGDLWILDIAKYQWSKGNISNPIVDLELHGHTATLVDNYMFIAFGSFLNNSVSSNIFILDANQKISYKWITEFPPIQNNTDINSTKIQEHENTNLIIGAIIGGTLIVFAIVAVILTSKFVIIIN